ISPTVFIPIAEESGIILQLGEWALREACREAASWDKPLSVAVNVSAVQLYSHDFTQRVHSALLQTGLPAHRLELEITETALIKDTN
ncbi:EAL domain-containing protein, partial [Klebsiella pneumoniae]